MLDVKVINIFQFNNFFIEFQNYQKTLMLTVAFKKSRQVRKRLLSSDVADNYWR